MSEAKESSVRVLESFSSKSNPPLDFERAVKKVLDESLRDQVSRNASVPKKLLEDLAGNPRQDGKKR